MKRIERDEWVAGLRSDDEFPQGQGHLATLYNGSVAFCCLGVKCELDVRAGRHGIVRTDGMVAAGTTGTWAYGVAGKDSSNTMPTGLILDAWGLPEAQAGYLAEVNDDMGEAHMSFAEIADWIEENVPVED